MSVDTHLRIEGGGDCPPLLLLHGVGLDLTMWDGVVDALAAAEHQEQGARGGETQAALGIDIRLRRDLGEQALVPF